MSLSTKANDWEVAGVAQVGGAAAVGGGVWWLEFRSSAAGMKETFMFGGLGIGVGGSVGGASAPDFSTAQPSYSPLACERAFSIHDLNYSAGRLTTAGAGLAVGYGLVYVSAFNFDGALFSSQSCHGFTVGVGASAITTVGMWRSMTLAARDASSRSSGYLRHAAAR
jgi:hypothetical protein